ncbi:MAG: TetR/AcrR family transcriptional regulator [Litorimonas sp.]
MATGSDAMSSSNTRQSRVRKREGAIISAGRSVFTTYGYAKATMAMIAREAGVADGTLYTYFDNKDALARGVVADYYARLTGTAKEGVDSRRTTRTRLDFLARHHITSIMEERGIVEMLPLLSSNLSDYSKDELYGLNKTYVAVFDGLIREGRASGDIPGDADVAVLRDIFFGALDYGARSSLLRSSRKGARNADITRLVDRLVSMIVGTNTSTGSLADRLEAVVDRVETALKEVGN